MDQILAEGVIADENGHEHGLTQTTKMRKAISLDVRLWIEGEDEPTHDFAQSTTEAGHPRSITVAKGVGTQSALSTRFLRKFSWRSPPSPNGGHP